MNNREDEKEKEGEEEDEDPVRERAAPRLPSNPVARALIVPLIPFVFTWELLHALVTRGVPALGRALQALGRCALVPLQALWEAGKAVTQRVWFIIRWLARLVWSALRATGLALRAVAVRLGMAARLLARAIWHGARACGTVLKALAMRVFVSIRAATSVLVRLLKGLGLAVVELLQRMGVALRHFVGLAVRGLRAVCRRAAAVLRALLTPVLRGLIAMGHRIVKRLAQVARTVLGMVCKVGAWLAVAGAWVWDVVCALLSSCADAVWRLGAALGLRLRLLAESVWSIASFLIRTMDRACAWLLSGATRLMRMVAHGLGRILRPLVQCLWQASVRALTATRMALAWAVLRVNAIIVRVARILGAWWAFLCCGCWRLVAAIASIAVRLFGHLAQGVTMLGRLIRGVVATLAQVCAVAVRRFGSALGLRLRLLAESVWFITALLLRTTGKALRWLAFGAIRLARAVARGLGRIVLPLLHCVARVAAHALAFARTAIFRALRFVAGIFTGMFRVVRAALKWTLRSMRSLAMAVGHALQQVRLSVAATLRAVRTTISSHIKNVDKDTG